MDKVESGLEQEGASVFSEATMHQMKDSPGSSQGQSDEETIRSSLQALSPATKNFQVIELRDI